MSELSQPNDKPLFLLGKAKYFAIAFIAVATIIAYIPAMNGGFIWDDDDYVTENETLHSLDGLKRIWFEFGAVPQYYPLVHTTYWIEYRLWGENPLGFHVVNVFLHIANALLLMLILARLRIPGAFLAALIFALHPVNVESVAWITERKNCLSGLFYLAAMWFAINAFKLVGDNDQNSDKKFDWKCYSTALVLYVAALFSKTVTASLPAAILLLIYWKRGRITKKAIIPLLPFFAVGLILSAVTVWIEDNLVSGDVFELGFSFAERLMLAGHIPWFYAGKILYPVELAFIYSRWNVESWSAIHWLPLVGVAVLIGALWYWRGKIGRGPLTAVLYFGGTLVPALGFIDVYPFRFSFVADHFQYLASIGLIVLAAGAATTFITTKVRQNRHTVYAITAGTLALILGTMTWQQGKIYDNLETLWRDTLAKNPDSWMPLENLAQEMHRQQRHDEAIEYYQKAIELNSDDPVTNFNLGTVYMELKKFEKAVPWFHRAIKLQPNYPAARGNLGISYLQINESGKAIEQAEELLKLIPGDERAMMLLNQALELHRDTANQLANSGKPQEAAEYYKAFLKYRPDAETVYRLALTQEAMGKIDDAIYLMEAALELDPNHSGARQKLRELQR